MAESRTVSRRENIEGLLTRIGKSCTAIGRTLRLMEVCGTHTVAFRQSGVLSLLPRTIRMVSGPGCPVCVTPASYIENVLRLIDEEDVIIATFGDMLKVPDRRGRSLSAFMGTDRVKIVYSPSELLPLAEQTKRSVIFLGIGFETTIPVIASVFLRAAEQKIDNLFLYPAFKLVPPALRALLRDPDSGIDGFLLPGHVSAVIGLEAYRFLCEEYNTPGVVTGFEPEDLLRGIDMLLAVLVRGTCAVRNGYSRVVRNDGNGKARAVMNRLLQPGNSLWRGLGMIPGSGMELRPAFKQLDAKDRFGIPELVNTDPKGCLCGRIIQGKSSPPDCGLFGKECIPEEPVGPCMVSSEGACAAYFQYGGIGST